MHREVIIFIRYKYIDVGLCIHRSTACRIVNFDIVEFGIWMLRAQPNSNAKERDTRYNVRGTSRLQTFKGMALYFVLVQRCTVR